MDGKKLNMKNCLEEKKTKNFFEQQIISGLKEVFCSYAKPIVQLWKLIYE